MSPEVAAALRECRQHFVAALAFSLGINLLYLALPLYMLQVYDRVLSSGSIPTLVLLTVACLIALATLAALDIVRARVLIRGGLRLDRLLSRRILSAMLERANDVGGVARAQALRDFDAYRQTVTGAGIHALFDAPWAPVYIVVIFIVNPLLGGLALACALVLISLALANEHATRAPLAAATEAAVRSHSAIEAGLRNAEVIQAMGMLDNLTRRWLAERVPLLHLQTAASDSSALITGAIRFSRLFMQVLMLGMGAWLVVEHTITAGAMFAATIILGRALQPVEQLTATWRQLVAGRSAYARVVQLLAERRPASERLSLPRPAGRVTAESVLCIVPGIRRPVVSGVSFVLEPGEALGVIGPSAAGKSTLARLVVGVRRPTAGIVRLDGADTHAWDRSEWGRYVGYMPQDIELFSGTVTDNIARFAQSPDEAVVQAAMAAGAHEMILALPRGYETEIGEGGSHLSGGQRQRIALARALYGNPALVVLDEPNSSLDADGEVALATCLRSLKSAGTTVIVITHRVSLLNTVDRLLHLRNGAVEAYGPRTEVLAKLRLRAPVRSVAPAPAGQAPAQEGEG